MDNTPIYDVLFSMQVNLCERFTGLTPLGLRREKARDVFLLINRYNKYSIREQRNAKRKNVIRKQAGDDWF